MKTLLLASTSPRRFEILSQFGYKFSTHTLEVSEILNKNLNAKEQIQTLACKKMEEVLKTANTSKFKDFIALTADTMVVLNGQVLGKPKSFEEATQTLGQLSGQKHEVITAVALYCFETQKKIVFIDETQVWFHELSQKEIKNYVLTKEPFDKAGSYGIQGEGRFFVKKYTGSYWNVMGLPVEMLEKKLEELNWKVQKETTQRDRLAQRYFKICSQLRSQLHDGVELVAVSKKKTSEEIFNLYELGQRVFGESFIQESLEKQQRLIGRTPEISWHFIGHLQRNKVKYAVGCFDIIHSVDRMELIEEIEKQIVRKNEKSHKILKQKILLQVNIGEEKSKFGIQKKELPGFIEKVKESSCLELCGLMCLPPLTKDKEKQKHFFHEMKQLFDKFKKEYSHPGILSMGTSHDFEIAIEQGANMVRLGSCLFGPRT